MITLRDLSVWSSLQIKSCFVIMQHRLVERAAQVAAAAREQQQEMKVIGGVEMRIRDGNIFIEANVRTCECHLLILDFWGLKSSIAAGK